MANINFKWTRIFICVMIEVGLWCWRSLRLELRNVIHITRAKHLEEIFVYFGLETQFPQCCNTQLLPNLHGSLASITISFQIQFRQFHIVSRASSSLIWTSFTILIVLVSQIMSFTYAAWVRYDFCNDEVLHMHLCSPSPPMAHWVDNIPVITAFIYHY